jgi:hypothetical protein
MKAQLFAVMVACGLGALHQDYADEVQFVTLPDVVRTTVVRESNIPDYSRVTRVVRDREGVYEVTVRRDSDNEVLFVDPAGRLVRQQTITVSAPVQGMRPGFTETVTQTTAAPTVETFVRTLNDPRYQLIEKKENKEVYRDRETGSRWTVKVEREGE